MKEIFGYCSWTIFCMMFAATLSAETLPTAWQELAASAGDDLSAPVKERRVLQVLTPEQAQDYAAGTDPARILLPNGETLAEYLDRKERESAVGLVLKTVEPCVLFDGVVEGRRSLFVRADEERDCGVPELAGDVFKSHRARALWVSVRVSEISEPGELKLWPGGGAPDPAASMLSFSGEKGATAAAASLLLRLCDEESASPCEDGDLKASLSGGAARVEIILHGWMESLGRQAVSSPGQEIQAKSTVEPFWVKREDSDAIYYTEGSIGIGIDAPNATLHVKGPDLNFPNNRAMRIFVGGESPNFRDHIGIDGTAVSGFGIAFSGLGHHRGGLYARNVGGYSSNVGEMTLWSRSNGDIRLLGGNVGIGVDDPQERLDVEGNLRLSGATDKKISADGSLGIAATGDICIGNCG